MAPSVAQRGGCAVANSQHGRKPAPVWASVGVACLLAACSSVQLGDAGPAKVTVVERSLGVTPGTSAPLAPPVLSPAPSAPLPGQENAGKPGYYSVKPGDTLTRIGLDHGQSPRDLVRWNNLENPNLIEVGQVLRVAPPPKDPGAAPLVTPVAKASGADSRVKPRPLAETKPIPLKAEAKPPAEVSDEIKFGWPSGGTILERFDETRNKGVDIGGKAGDPVLAAAEGRVVYAGAGLRGYGNLVILKHNNTYLTAYAHNQTLLVKEDQTVRQGQKIAEMGNSDTDRVKLHFEVRRQGKPVDPLKYLSAR